MDEYTEVTTQGWLSRLGDSIKGVLLGMILVVGSCPAHCLNEGRAVETAKALDEGAGVVIEVSADKVDAANEGKLVHISGPSAAAGELADPVFGVKAQGIRLARTVEMYQWREHVSTESETKPGGEKKTWKTYSYDTEWSSTLIHSASFKKSKGHGNPKKMPHQSASWSAPKVTVGSFSLARGLVDQITGDSAVEPKPGDVPGDLREAAQPIGDWLYVGEDFKDPDIGDLRIKWRVTPTGPVSVVAQQTGATLGPYSTKVGRTLEMLSMGAVDAARMFEQGQKDNVVLTWALRLVGFLMLFIGLTLIFKPLSVAADVVPLIGSLVGAGATMAAFAIALPFTLLFISLSWIAHRPLIGGLLLLLAAAIAGGVGKLVAKQAQSSTA